MTPLIRPLTIAAILALALGGCATTSAPTADPQNGIRLPPAGVGFDYQLGGPYDPPAGVVVVARDSTVEPASGSYNICYINGFQTQPGEAALWLSPHPDLLLHDEAGEPIVDPDWPDEYLLDTSSPQKRSQIADLLTARIAACASADYDAVEIDNLDSYSRSNGALTLENNIALATAYATAAHDLNLAIAQKNGAGSSQQFRDAVGFDFAVTEECARYDECADYTDTYGALVFDIEYSASHLAAACTAVGSAILRDLDLTTPDHADYVFKSC
ncbi:MAG: endo alpha-1,4 polygalactosaminidase [Pseudolysinimonas sp.]|uniref:endo alpha-1,4 polygalactosaminidase n=1 Tax=Pseudolysinimonas sp. TaxID=2680009 RepID=UPI0032650853